MRETPTVSQSQIITKVDQSDRDPSSSDAIVKPHDPAVSSAPKYDCEVGFDDDGYHDAPLFNDSFWKDVAKTKRDINRLGKALEKKKRILAIYYEGVRQYFEEVDVTDQAE